MWLWNYQTRKRFVYSSKAKQKTENAQSDVRTQIGQDDTVHCCTLHTGTNCHSITVSVRIRRLVRLYACVSVNSYLPLLVHNSPEWVLRATATATGCGGERWGAVGSVHRCSHRCLHTRAPRSTLKLYHTVDICAWSFVSAYSHTYKYGNTTTKSSPVGTVFKLIANPVISHWFACIRRKQFVRKRKENLS